MIKRVFLLILLFPKVAFSIPRMWGIDALGLARWSDEAIDAIPSGMAIGLFTQKDLFGAKALENLEKVLKKRNTPLVRYNLRWSDTHSFPKSDWGKIVEEAKRIVPVIEKYPFAECQVSGATEHQLNATDAKELARRVLAVLPSKCVYVNNPFGKGAYITGERIINEVHGGSAKKPPVGGKYNFSFDGTDAFDVDVEKLKNKFSDSDVFFVWTSQNNGKKNSGDKTPRPERRAFPVPKLVLAQAFLFTSQGEVSLPKNYLVKSKADQHNVPPEPRALKPVMIFPVKAERIELRGNGKKFVSAKGLPFVDGRTRYYFDLFGYEIVRSAGVNVLDVYINGKKVGTTNPAFRQGTFR